MGKRNITMKTPFLWSGSKDKNWKQIEKFLYNPEKYVEPFLGGGSIYFRLLDKYGAIKAEVSDINTQLINCYKHIQSDVEWICNNLPEQKDRELFNFWKSEKLNLGKEDAMKFLYLNRNRFFGLGGWMVADRYAREAVISRLRYFSERMKNTIFLQNCWDINLEENTLAFCDPPYPETNNKSCYKINEKEIISLNLNYLKNLKKSNCSFLFTTKLIEEIRCFCVDNNLSYDIKKWNFRKPGKEVQESEEIWIFSNDFKEKINETL